MRGLLIIPGWTPLIYCWRGGQRSGSMARILAEIGWVVSVLDGGYKSYRQAVIDGLTPLAEAIQPMLLQGPTGSAKTCILRAAASAGVQIIDLEDLAAHRGSLLGAEPDRQQPSQRLFESMLMQALQRIDPTRPVLIEAESSRIGSCHLPKGLWRQMINAPQIMIDAPVAARVDFLIRSYPHICADPGLLDKLINGMTRRHGHAICDGWRQLAESKDWQGLVTALINEHYDPPMPHQVNAATVLLSKDLRQSISTMMILKDWPGRLHPTTKVKSLFLIFLACIWPLISLLRFHYSPVAQRRAVDC